MNGGVEHAAEVGAIDRTARELVHDHEHPVAPEHDGLASTPGQTRPAHCEAHCRPTARDPAAAATTPATPPHKGAHTATGGTGLASGWTRITPD